MLAPCCSILCLGALFWIIVASVPEWGAVDSGVNVKSQEFHQGLLWGIIAFMCVVALVAMFVVGLWYLPFLFFLHGRNFRFTEFWNFDC